MASFDPDERRDARSNSNAGFEIKKYNIKQVQLSIKKFIKVLEIDLDRLYKHSINIARVSF